MRISDWSSDVCSSDLRPDRADLGALGPAGPGGRRGQRGRAALCLRRRAAVAAQPDLDLREPADALADRKSVVSGKSVSVRVDLGGRRIIKNKNNRNTVVL